MRTQRNKKSRSALIAATTAVMTAMSTSGSLLASSLPQGCYLEEFPRVIQSSQSIDLLFVTDTSASLANDKAKIAAGIDAFVASLSPKTDYQIAVMPAHGSRGLSPGALWKYRNNPYVLSSKTMSLSQIQKALYENLVEAPQDYYADGGEEGLYSLNRSMDQGKLDVIRAKGFFRPNAALAVVFISDENDICAIYPAGVKRVPDPEGLEIPAFKRDCAGITPSSVFQRLLQLQNGRPLIVSGVLYNDLKTVPHQGGQDEYGYGYMDLISLGGGVSVDIAKGNFAAGLAQIGEFSAKQMQSTVDFKLANSPVDPNSILVTLRNSSAHSSDDDDDHGHGHGGGSCHCKYENGSNGSSRHCEADDKDKFDSRWGSHSQWHSKSISSSTSGTSDGRVVDFNFDDRINVVHILDETASEPLAEIQYCLKSVSPSPSPTVVPSPSPTVVPTPSPTVTVTPTPDPSPTVTVTPTPSPSATVDPTPSPTVTVTPTPDPSPTVVPTPSPTVIPSPSPTVAPSPSPTVTVTPTPDPSPTVVPSPSPTVDPSPTPSVTVTPTPDPSPTVTVTPTPDPSPTVTVTPTPDPSPTVTVTPSPSPTVTVTPSPSPTVDPSPSPSPTGCTGPFCGPGAGT